MHPIDKDNRQRIAEDAMRVLLSAPEVVSGLTNADMSPHVVRLVANISVAMADALLNKLNAPPQ